MLSGALDGRVRDLIREVGRDTILRKLEDGLVRKVEFAFGLTWSGRALVSSWKVPFTLVVCFGRYRGSNFKEKRTTVKSRL